MKGKTETKNVESSTSTKKVEEMFKEYPLHSAPYDKDGFIQSFQVDDVAGFKKFFDEYGFVVVDGILNQEEIKETLNEVWDTLENTKWGVKMEKINRNDPSTWEDDRWPMAVRSLGILGHDTASGKQAWMNRQNEKLYKVFSVLMNKKELWASVDRYGIMRPTKNIPIGKLKADGTRELEDRPSWKTVPAWLHWDLNPYKWIGAQEGMEYEFQDFITENNGSKNDGLLKLQGLVAITESREEDGGFCTVSGFHKHLPEWCELTANTDFAARTKKTFDFVSAPKGDPMFQQIQNITCRAGSLVVWRGEQPHCNYPNNSNRFRINQYIKCFPAQPKGKGVDMRKSEIKYMLPEDFKVTKLGEKLFGLKDW